MGSKIIAIASLFVLALARVTQATVVYDTSVGGARGVVQQAGNNTYYIGDVATFALAGGTLTNIKIPFAVTDYDGAGNATSPFTYTPNLSLDLYSTAADAAANTNFLGSATVNNVTFTHTGNTAGQTYTVQDEQLLTFDFSSQNITLPLSFAFAYHDNAADGGRAANGFSVYVTNKVASPGVSDQNFFDTYPNNVSSDLYEANPGFNIAAQINAVVPEPASLATLAAVALVGRRRRR